jgi:triacylglycerol esterase/lipase EstA (alpha/beta hydrolase family)
VDERVHRPRRWRRRLLGTAVVGAVASLVLLLTGGPVAWPFDWLLNLGAPVVVDAARAPADGTVRVVVLQHGLFRTAASLGRLERSLRAHGYEVMNVGYASTRAPVEVHARSLAAAIASRSARGAVHEWRFVGHSMGGLVIEEYLRSPGAVEPSACVYLGTPHRGAMLADLRKRWFLFRWAMGTSAARQLSPGDAFHQQPLPWLDRSGAIVGDIGSGNSAIPGDDDGTVAVGEAALPVPARTVHVAAGHTGLTTSRQALRQVLHWLAFRAFAPDPRPQ